MTYLKRRAFVGRLTRQEKPRADPKLVAKNTIVLYFRMLIVMFVGLFTSRLQLQALGVENFGLYNVAMAVVTMFGFLDGALSLASMRFLTVELGRGTVGSLKRMFSTVLVVHFAVGAIIVILLETIGLFVLSTKLNIDPSRIGAVGWAYQCAVITLFLSITQVPYSAVIIAHERMSVYAYMSFYDVGVKLLIVSSLFVLHFDQLKIYATLLMLSSCISIALYRVYCIRNFTEARFRRFFDRSRVRGIFSFVGWQVISKFVIMLTLQGFTMVNQRCFGPALVAAITLAGAVNMHVQNFIRHFKTAADPQVTKLFAAKDYVNAKNMLTDVIHYSLFLLLIFGLPIWFYAPEVLTIWLGDNVPEHTARLVQIILIGSLAAIFDSSFFIIVNADGRLRCNTICDVVSFGSMFLLGCVGAMVYKNPYATSIAFALACGIQGFVQKPLMLHFMFGYTMGDFRKIAIPAVEAVVLAGACTAGIRACVQGVVWAVPSCALAALMNGWMIFTFVATDRVQRQLLRILLRMGAPGRFAAGVVESYLVKVNRFRRRVSGVLQ